MKILAWNKDRWLSKNQKIPFTKIYMYDKLAHVIRELTLTFTPLFFFGFPLAWIIGVLTFGDLFEVKDGIRPYDNKGHIEGLSLKDLISNRVGIAIGTLLWLILKRL